LPLLPLFCSLRAYVRAIIGSKNLPDLPENAKDDCRNQAKKYYELSEAFLSIPIREEQPDFTIQTVEDAS
jgi:aminoglycoside phosphotransferase family enzyme